MQLENVTGSEEKSLLERLIQEDRSAFEQIYNNYWSKLYIYAYNILRDRQASEDIVQEVLVSLWLKRKVLEINSLNAFLFTSVRYQVLKYIRSGKVRENFFLEIEQISESTAIELITEKNINDMIDIHVTKLPARCREIFLMSRKQHLSNKEIAERLNISSKTVENQITIALRGLRIALGEFFTLYLLFFVK